MTQSEEDAEHAWQEHVADVLRKHDVQRRYKAANRPHPAQFDTPW